MENLRKIVRIMDENLTRALNNSTPAIAYNYLNRFTNFPNISTDSSGCLTKEIVDALISLATRLVYEDSGRVPPMSAFFARGNRIMNAVAEMPNLSALTLKDGFDTVRLGDAAANPAYATRLIPYRLQAEGRVGFYCGGDFYLSKNDQAAIMPIAGFGRVSVSFGEHTPIRDHNAPHGLQLPDQGDTPIVHHSLAGDVNLRNGQRVLVTPGDEIRFQGNNPGLFRVHCVWYLAADGEIDMSNLSSRNDVCLTNELPQIVNDALIVLRTRADPNQIEIGSHDAVWEPWLMIVSIATSYYINKLQEPLFPSMLLTPVAAGAMVGPVIGQLR